MFDKIAGLRQRIKKFVLSLISFAKLVPKDEVGRVFVNQLLRSGTSIGANFEESSEAQTEKDIIYKLSVVKKEAKETKYWIDLVAESYSDLSVSGRSLMQECDELIRIFSSIIYKKKLDLNH